MSTSKLIAAVLAGAATGAILGVLFAPGKGSVTRKKIAKKGTHFRDAAKKGYNKIGETIAGKYENIKNDAMNPVEKEREKAGSNNKKNNGLKSQWTF